MRAALLSVLLLMAAGCATVPGVGARGSVLAVDDQQRAMVATSDLTRLERLAHRNLRINAPGGRVLTREQFLANIRNGEISAEAFERIAEDVQISGTTAVIMGRETFTPTASSELGRTFGAKPLQRRYSNVYVWDQGRWRWLARHANVVQPASAAKPLHDSAMHVGVPGRCEAPAVGGGGAIGCYLNLSVPAGPLSGRVYWHIDRFPDMASAKAANSSGGSAVTALGGEVFLYTLNAKAGWRPARGERLATIGPMTVPGGGKLIARYMEATTNSPAQTRVHRHSGPEAFYLHEGAICIETTSGATRITKGKSDWLPGNLSMQLSNGASLRRSLLLVLHPADQPWMTAETQWKPSGLCSR